jgi:predicted NBD/HSP70 family sugar kinase
VCSKGQTGPDRLAALGVGVRAIVNTQHGVVLTWPNTPAWAAGWAGLDVPAALRGRLHVDRVFVDDSVRTMARAAHRAGPARGVSEFIYVFLGTGIGSAVFTHGRPYAGRSGMAGELGHVAIDERGPRCTCGNRGCLEMLASTPAVLRRARERLAESPHPSLLSEAHAHNRLTLQALHEAAQAGDKQAIQVLTETGTDVGRGLAIALNLLDPEMVVLGGPLVHEGGVLVDAVRREARLRALPHISRALRIACDDQGAMAGARGAAFLALDAIFAPDGMAV